MGTNVATVGGIRILGPAILRSVWRTHAGAEPHQTGEKLWSVSGTGYLKQTSKDAAIIKQSHCTTRLAKL